MVAQITMMLKCLAILSSQNLQTSVLLLYLQVGDFTGSVEILLCSRLVLDNKILHVYSLVLDSLVDPLQKTINFKPKQDAVKQEVDRNEDMIRSALRSIASLNRIRFSPLNCIYISY